MKKSIVRLIKRIEHRYPDMHYDVSLSWHRHYEFVSRLYITVEDPDGTTWVECETVEAGTFGSEKEMKDFLAIDNEEHDEGVWRVLWDNGHCIDSTHGFESFERAKDEAMWILMEWERCFVEENGVDFDDRDNWPHNIKLDWDEMVTECSVSVVQKNANGHFDTYWSPSYEELLDIGWVTFDEEE